MPVSLPLSPSSSSSTLYNALYDRFRQSTAPWLVSNQYFVSLPLGRRNSCGLVKPSRLLHTHPLVRQFPELWARTLTPGEISSPAGTSGVSWKLLHIDTGGLRVQGSFSSLNGPFCFSNHDNIKQQQQQQQQQQYITEPNSDLAMKANKRRSLVRTIRKRQATFLGHVMIRGKLEHLVTTGKFEGKRSRGRQREKIMDGLATWLGPGKVSDILAAVKDRDLWRDMIANAYKKGT
ncbi:hypothetical protein PoB_002716300 [Plakobranchus ocellatus]|uniref:Uncharacterized protein n=1 Tax=Plakobranchus ocellatus TaxID=259542 RepID=A0AAV4A217_9GAST|nr:hypothetical protein PoB_002716300 [Plakobranchus ocellatus]